MHALSPSVVDTHTQAPQKRGSPQTEGSVHDRRGTVVVGPGVPTWAKVGVVTLWTIGVAQTRPAPTAPFLMRFRLDSSNALPPSPDAGPVSSQHRDAARGQASGAPTSGTRRFSSAQAVGWLGDTGGAFGDCARFARSGAPPRTRPR